MRETPGSSARSRPRVLRDRRYGWRVVNLYNALVDGLREAVVAAVRRNAA